MNDKITHDPWLAASPLAGLLFLLFLFPMSLLADGPARAPLPKFDPQQVSDVFFADVFAELKGERPSKPSAAEGSADTSVAGQAARVEATMAVTATDWSGLIAGTVLEDEIKSSKLAIDRSLTSPSSFASRGHLVARSHFSLLAVLFAVVEQYQEEVRFKHSAAVMRNRLARFVQQTVEADPARDFAAAQSLRLDLSTLLNGARLTANDESSPPSTWGGVADRSVLMKRLQAAVRKRLLPGTSSPAEFERAADDVLHESQMVAMIARILADATMEDGDDPDYTAFAVEMEDAARASTKAVRVGDFEMLQASVSRINRACARCHELYR